ncbi:tyrosine--tRNA ligase [Halarsenatibacter silvermanii]|uniref:Tyrosine--tRNA ligase n=1 Tax=Halarsenatibacter silvermanii TaxID=321763 RepID=A0A1G9K364_9FIRM|nr:tyrosine--tRNA ligase [Halarsenatibacter silvermanii]SDL43663.1 tyrosyl-tRNA synthetase [Halarsenatibacter silvermanii]
MIKLSKTQRKYSVEEQMKVLTQGVEELIDRDGLQEKLKNAEKEDRPLRVKLGLDPSAPDLHVGHTVVLNKLKQFQDFGHEVHLIIGDFTGMIGDPSGKSQTRSQLTEEEVQKNAQTYEEQFSRILDPEKTRLHFNSSWLGELDATDVINISSRYTVARMLEREDFARRMESNQPISIHEFLYPLMQGYDSVALEADIELGGTDQKFNLLVGRKLQKEFGQKPQILVMMPLLEGLDGEDKMSKSLDNYIGIEEKPADMFGKAMSLPDHLIYRYFELLTDVDPDELKELEDRLDKGEENPRDIKRELAHNLVERFYDEVKAEEAAEEFDKVFLEGGIPEDLPEIKISSEDLDENDEIWIVDLITRAGFADSNSEAMRLIDQGAVSLDEHKIETADYDLDVEHGTILKVGKKRFAKILREDR